MTNSVDPPEITVVAGSVSVEAADKTRLAWVPGGSVRHTPCVKVETEVETEVETARVED